MLPDLATLAGNLVLYVLLCRNAKAKKGLRNMKQVLFLCSANYYRSRFAEHLFNWLAPQLGLDWRADSMGLDMERWSHLRAICLGMSSRLSRSGASPSMAITEIQSGSPCLVLPTPNWSLHERI